MTSRCSILTIATFISVFCDIWERPQLGSLVICILKDSVYRRDPTAEVNFLFLPQARTDIALKEGIAEFYDESSGVWEDMWGEHMHHGYYPPGQNVDNRQAQIDMIENSLTWAQIPGETHAPTPFIRRAQSAVCF